MLKRTIIAVSLAAAGHGAAIGAEPGLPAGALHQAIALYNALPNVKRPLALDEPAPAPGTTDILLPQWVAGLDLSGVEAAALAVTVGTYRGSFDAPQDRRWSAGELAAGAAAGLAASAGSSRRGDNYTVDWAPQTRPSSPQMLARNAALAGALRSMRSCTGALVSLATKLAAVRPGDELTRLVVRAKRDLGAAAMPPDNRCMS